MEIFKNFKEFWDRFWDKILLLFMATVISGVTGYYSGILSIKAEIQGINNRLIKLETELNISVNPKVNSIEGLKEKIKTLENTLDNMRQKDEIETAARLLLQQLIEKEKNKTVNDLKELLKR